MIDFVKMTLKMIKAIRLKYGVTLLLSTEQRISEKSGRVYTEYKLSLGMTVEQFNRMYPNDEKNPKVYKSKYAGRVLYQGIKKEELFQYVLEEIWKPLESGEMYEKGITESAKIRSRYSTRRGQRRGGSKGVLQDAQVGEELPGGISGDEYRDGDGKMSGDIGEA